MAYRYGQRGKPVRHRWGDPLSQMDPLEFERLVGSYFSEQGFRVEHVGTGGTASRYDGGIDLMLYRGDERVVVQCKRWTAYQVPHNEVHQLLGIMHTERATGAIFVTSGEFTKAAVEKVRGIAGFRLIDGQELRRLLGPLLDSIQVSEGRHESGAPLASGFVQAARPKSSRELPPIDAGRGLRQSKPDLGPILFVVALVLVMMLSCVRHMTRSSQGKAAVSAERASVANPAVQPRQVSRAVTAVRRDKAFVTVAPVSVSKAGRQTPEEAREAKRRADEAMRVIEATTPEM